MQNIVINYDFKTGKELSYKQALYEKGDFETNCIVFFNREKCNVTIRRSDGRYINNQEVYSNKYDYTKKEIRTSHNLLKMFIAGAFKWRKVCRD